MFSLRGAFRFSLLLLQFNLLFAMFVIAFHRSSPICFAIKHHKHKRKTVRFLHMEFFYYISMGSLPDPYPFRFLPSNSLQHPPTRHHNERVLTILKEALWWVENNIFLASNWKVNFTGFHATRNVKNSEKWKEPRSCKRDVYS